jgi:predicted ATPase
VHFHEAWHNPSLLDPYGSESLLHISSIQVSNYKSFLSSGAIHLKSGFNVIVGQNNVGKTALVEALGLQFRNNPHRSLETLRSRSSVPENTSTVEISCDLGEMELRDMLAALPELYVPIGSGSSDVPTEGKRFLDSISERNTISCVLLNGGLVSAHLEAYGTGWNGQYMRAFRLGRADVDAIEPGPSTGLHEFNEGQQFASHLASVAVGRIYSFKAVRFNIGSNQPASEPSLMPDASNLAQVLNHLQTTNPRRFDRFNELVRTIFPQIRQITVPPVQGTNEVHILVWNVEPESERDDLAVALSESGTGLGQVLAMLYVVLTSEYARAIVIDEPQSFLHPGAVRKLFDILKQYPEHQYIITTHSSTAVTAADPQTLFLIRKQGAESVVETIDVNESQELSRFLSEIGARLSDVFGADDILWVEGRTEELCFPLIISRLVERPLLGTAVVGVVHTGDFESKHSGMIFEVYRRLSESRGLLPPAVGFIFDQEERTEEERQDLIRQSRQTIHFTPRRMYENYLLNPSAIASIMSNTEGLSHRSVTTENIEGWIKRNGEDKKYFGRRKASGPALTNKDWFSDVRGAKVLDDLFDEQSEGTVAYDKVSHGFALTEWIIGNAPEDLGEIRDLLKDVLPPPTTL